MSISVHPEWWKTIFDEMYLLTDSRSVCNDDLTCREVSFIINVLKPGKEDPILDLCGGQGRHAMELSRRGFANVTVMDYSPYLVKVGCDTARDQNLNICFIQGDARNVCFPEESFNCVLLMGSSFGYFVTEDENMKILGEAYRLLPSGGRFMIDLPDKDFVLTHFKPYSSHTVGDDIEVRRYREIDGDVVFSREVVIDGTGEALRENRYLTRLFDTDKLNELLDKAGFSTVSFSGDFMSRNDEGDYGFMTNRMIAVAEK